MVYVFNRLNLPATEVHSMVGVLNNFELTVNVPELIYYILYNNCDQNEFKSQQKYHAIKNFVTLSVSGDVLK